ncbi:helix-turn-helix transcriptional regulator (plasmid) [Gluconobacter sphaericus]|uniref:helix-turn-helix domain-containing protein n=1 Tax=Gluconobacter sphaericus TaxID=574987 RepID=UPI001924740A|nr:helix-turn-helix transcriptional regulator [Gluconobacter sphaericus]QQX92808.1 helix-turn-helix transcriptional regulator [Gluconobacter sphaericus]
MEQTDALRERFKNLVDNYNLSIQKIAKESGVNHQTLYHFKDNVRTPQDKTIEKISRYISNFKENDEKPNFVERKKDNNSKNIYDIFESYKDKIAKETGIPKEKIELSLKI